MRAAIYARKSNDDLHEAEDRSIARQIAHARQYARRKGWDVAAEHVYADDGFSGAEFKNRPALLRLLNALKPAPPFDVVVMMEPSRLGRDRLSTELVARDLVEAGVRLFYYLTDEEERLDTPEQRFVMAARGFAAEMEREKAKQRTRDALLARAKRGRVTGGVVYGYRNVQVVAGTDASGNPLRSHVRHEINDTEAKVIRGMFRMYADGYGLKKIARTLNGDPKLEPEAREYFHGRRVPPPRKGSGSWAPSCINAILRRDRYRGRITWGRYRNTDKAGRTRCRAKQPERDWVVVEVPELRIVTESLWTAAQERRARRTTPKSSATSRRSQRMKPPAPRASKSLLSGLATCTQCGGPIAIAGSRRSGPCYGCSYYRNRGVTVCDNSCLETTYIVDTRLLEEIERQVLTADARSYVLERAAALVRERTAAAPDRLTTVRAEAAKAERELENL